MLLFFSFSFRSIVNEGPNEFLNVRAPLYLAGVPEQTGTKAWKQWHLRNTTSFIGESNFLSEKIVKTRYIPDYVVFECSRAFIFGGGSRTDWNKKLGNKFYLSFTRKPKKNVKTRIYFLRVFRNT